MLLKTRRLAIDEPDQVHVDVLRRDGVLVEVRRDDFCR